jgi:UDP-MurNAc hydroxylase
VGEIRPGTFEVAHPVPDAEIERIFGDRGGYLREYQARVRPLLEAEHARWEGERVDLLAELRPWFEPLMAMADHVSSGIGDRILLDVGDEGIVLDFVDRAVRAWDGREECRYRFWVDRRLVETLVREREVDWVNSLFLSMRFRASRTGQYNDYVYTWFKCLDVERIQYAEGFYAEKAKSEGTFALGGWEIQRRCPHMKADLTRFATVDDGVLTCQLHGWQFDLATGACLTSADHPVEARRLTEDEIDALSAAAEASGAGVATPG